MAKYSEIFDWIDQGQTEMVERVQAWSLINTSSLNIEGLKAFGEVIEEAFSCLGAKLTIHDLPYGRRVADDGRIINVPYGPLYHFSKRPEANRRVLMTGHLDTVFGKDHSFQTPLFLDDNTLNGPGVADMKGGIIVMLKALEALEKFEGADNIGYDILLSPDEETGSLASAPYLSEFAKRANFGMTYEPALADGTLAGDRKGSGNFTVIVKGRSAHAGREIEKGRNAVVALSHIILELEALNGKKENLTLNPASIHGGVANNVVPDMALLHFNIRVGNDDEQLWVENEIEKILNKENEKNGISVEFHGGFNRPPKKLTKNNIRLFEILKECGTELDIDISWTPTGGCCEGNNLAAVGLPNIDTLGVRGGKIHSPQEFVLVDSFSERAKLSAKLLMKYASGEFEIYREKDCTTGEGQV